MAHQRSTEQDSPRIAYIDHITFMDGSTEEIRDWIDIDHTENWLVYLFSSEVLRFATHRVSHVVTTKEEVCHETQ